jgi:hypothetical protein
LVLLVNAQKEASHASEIKSPVAGDLIVLHRLRSGNDGRIEDLLVLLRRP